MAEGRKNGISGNFELRGRLFLLFDEVRVSFLGGAEVWLDLERIKEFSGFGF